MENPLEAGIRRAAPQDKAILSDKRQRFIQYELGLTHDPFLHSVAEQELQYEADQFFVYYVDVGSYQAANILDVLTHPVHCAVVAPSGGGKTTLRLNLVRRLHQSASNILPVLCDLDPLRSFSAREARSLLNLELEKDLFIALLDRFDPFAPTTIEPDSALGLVLGHLLQQPTYARLLERIAASRTGVALNTFWEELGRAGLPPASWASPEMQDFTRSLLALKRDVPVQLVQERMPEALEELGFVHAFLLIDGIDAAVRPLAEMMRLLRLLVEAALAHPVHFSLKIFAPVELGPALAELQPALGAGAPLTVIELEWTDESLADALLQRLRAAGASLDDGIALFGDEDAERLQQELLQAAGGSPRRLYQLISRIVDAHIRTGNTQPALTYDDWQAVQATAPIS